MSLIVIGDIHGNLPALDDLLSKIESASPEEVVFLGDYIDRGPDSRACVQRILDFRDQAEFPVTCLMGNHEDWMLRSYHDLTKHSWLVGMEAETIASYSTRLMISFEANWSRQDSSSSQRRSSFRTTSSSMRCPGVTWSSFST